MSEKKRASYTPEFRKKATDLALTSGHPTSYVAQLLKIKESTLGNWVAREKKKGRVSRRAVTKKTQKAESEETLYTEKNSSEKNDISSIHRKIPDLLDNSNDPSPMNQKHTEVSSKRCDNQNPTELFQEISENLPQELQRLRQENHRLERERNIYREAIILLASQTGTVYA